MSRLKMVPEGLKPRECERIKLREPPPVPYVPVKDEVQDDVVRMQSMEIKMMIKKDTTLNFLVWQENRTCEAFLMHVTTVIDAIKKRGHLDDYEKAEWEYEKAKKSRARKRPRKARRRLRQRLQNPSYLPRKLRLLLPRMTT
jgi:hypothetical protein